MSGDHATSGQECRIAALSLLSSRPRQLGLGDGIDVKHGPGQPGGLGAHRARSDASYPAVLAALEPVRRRGVRLAIDDAGAGFASFQHILLLKPDVIKLDISLTRDIDRDPVRRSLGVALVTFAGEMDAVIVAESIETASEYDMLDALGVDLGQGYHIARPAPWKEIVLNPALVSKARSVGAIA